ncbi:MAG: ATP-binding protein [Blastocatellia bacterium]
MTETTDARPSLSAEKWLPGGGRMGARIRAFDWASHPLGPIEGWPQSLKLTVRLMLTSRYAMWMGWGPEFYFFCNDAYLPTVGIKESWVLGASARRVWAEIWPDIGPRAESVVATGNATWDESLLLFLERSGYAEETYHTFSYSPVADDDGSIGGMLCVVTEETERVIGERRMTLLRELAADLTDTNEEPELFDAVRRQLGAHNKDLPFALVYLFEADGQQARLACAHGTAPGEAIAPLTIEVTADNVVWPASEILSRAEAVTVTDLSARFAALPTGPWDKPARQAAVVPIAQQGQERPAGFLVAGINPYRPLDLSYLGFINLLAGQIASALSNARAYEEERKRAEALAEIDRAKTMFFSNVSHEFRTPLTLMLGPLEDALASNGEVQPQTREQLETAHRNGVRLLKLVNTLLDFSRIEAGRADVSFEPVDLATFTAELASVFRSAVEKAGIKFIINCPPLESPVYVDREMWEKIVLNLISNAFKFTFAGEIEIRQRVVGSRVELSVRDTGTGIPAEELPHLFERFHRVKGARGRSIEGSGIGLSLVRELVRLHGGEVNVTSRINHGSIFTVSIPVGRAHLPADRVGATRARSSTALRADAYVEEALRWLPEASQADSAMRNEKSDSTSEIPHAARRTAHSRILLADDNADMRDYVRRLLGESYDVVTVANGRAALEAVREHRFDLVLTDVMMPELDGFGLLRALRADERTRDLPVIMLSARAGEESRVEGLEAGADDYLIKPFSARELLARVESNLKLARLRRETLIREQALRVEAEDARQRLEKVLASINDQFLVLDREWRYRYVNERVVQVVGLRREELLGRNIWELFPDTVGTILHEELHRAAAEQQPRYLEFYYPSWERWFENRIYPSSDNLTVLVTEITDRKRAEIERDQSLAQEQAARRQAEEASRLKDEFLATVSHELRTPLNHMLGWIVMLRAGRLSSGQAADALATIERNARAQNRLIEDLLDVSRIITGKLRLELQPVAIARVVEAAVASARPAAEAKGIILVNDSETDVDTVHGDADRLQQVVWNLVSNAIKFTPASGRVIVRLTQADARIILSVSDTGEGIEPEFLSYVFDRFSQADGSPRRRHGGLGLGLAIVRHLVELHGGEVSVESAGVGRGATFTVTLPVRPAERETPNEMTAAPSTIHHSHSVIADGAPRLDKVRVLVVDDEEDTRKIIAALLVESGAEVRTADSAAAATAILSEWTPVVIVADIGMPHEDGYEFIRRLRQYKTEHGEKQIPAVALTAYARSQDRLKAFTAGYQQHLSKPVEPTELLIVVASLAGRLGSDS